MTHLCSVRSTHEEHRAKIRRPTRLAVSCIPLILVRRVGYSSGRRSRRKQRTRGRTARHLPECYSRNVPFDPTQTLSAPSPEFAIVRLAYLAEEMIRDLNVQAGSEMVRMPKRPSPRNRKFARRELSASSRPGFLNREKLPKVSRSQAWNPGQRPRQRWLRGRLIFVANVLPTCF
jgi:hypothetical protein